MIKIGNNLFLNNMNQRKFMWNIFLMRMQIRVNELTCFNSQVQLLSFSTRWRKLRFFLFFFLNPSLSHHLLFRFFVICSNNNESSKSLFHVPHNTDFGLENLSPLSEPILILFKGWIFQSKSLDYLWSRVSSRP